MEQGVIWALYEITICVIFLSLIKMVGMKYLIKFLIYMHH